MNATWPTVCEKRLFLHSTELQFFDRTWPNVGRQSSRYFLPPMIKRSLLLLVFRYLVAFLDMYETLVFQCQVPIS